MEYKRILMVLLIRSVGICAAAPTPTGNESGENETVEGKGDWIMFTANESTIDEKNETEETNGTVKTSTVAASRPISLRIGPWLVMGCHNNDESWGCELRRVMHIATVGFIDTLKFTMLKGTSLKVANEKERCNVGCDGPRELPETFRIVIKCPRGESKCNDTTIRRMKSLYFQAGFLSALALMLAILLLCMCFVKDAKSKQPKTTIIQLVTQKNFPYKM